MTDEELQTYARAFHKVAENLDALLEYEAREQIGGEIQSTGRSINYV